MQVPGGTVAARGLVRYVRAVEHAVAQPVRQAGRPELVVAPGPGRAHRTADVAVVGQLGTVESVPELRGNPVPAARRELTAAMLARQHYRGLVTLRPGTAGRLE